MANRSGFAQKFHIVMDDGTEYEVRAGIVDAVRFEKAQKAELISPAGTISISNQMWLAWAAGFRQKLHTVARFDDWYPHVDDVANITLADDQQEAASEDGAPWPDTDPTPTAQPADSSSD